ncbi:MAG TPA: potassium-transporting ATPase subunit KdpC [Casimicrobiaceae bacterium]|jgi:K+-transporting ATPase ATPase C chain
MFAPFLSSLRMLVALSVLTGVVYPLVTWGIAQAAFPRAANGSLVTQDGKVAASSLIGQPFDDPKYFWSRPSATSPQPYNGASSSGSNLGPRNPALSDAVKDRIKALRDADPGNTAAVPADLVTASASGLDPDISIAAARFQTARVAKARGVSPETVGAIIDRNTTGRTFGLLGEPRINVVRLNLELDRSVK